MKKRVLITLDLDGTVIRSNGQIFPGNVEAVKRLAAAGFTVMFHSDTSEEGLCRHMLRLGLTRDHIHGVIPENGAYLKSWHAGLPSDRLFAPDFDIRRAQFRALRLALADRLVGLGWDVDLTHPATTAPLLHGVRQFSPVRVLLDVTRLVSFTAEVLEMGPAGLEVNESRTGEVSEIVRAEAEKIFGTEALNAAGDGLDRPEYGEGWIMLPGFGLSKGRPLVDLVGSGFDVWHVGDGSNEVPTAMVPGVTTVAVGAGCSFARKGKPTHVTRGEGPAGFVEAVDLILAAHSLSR